MRRDDGNTRGAVTSAPIWWDSSLPASYPAGETAAVGVGSAVEPIGAALRAETEGRAMSIDERAVARLRAAVRGAVITPDAGDYDEGRRVWNGMIDKRPAVIIRAGGEIDVAPVIAVARETGAPLAIRGGGHNVAGNGTVDDGILLDMGALRRVDVDAARRIVRVEAGATLADIDRATEPHGLAVPVGVVSGTGIAGLTLGGGVGWLTRCHGLTIDNLVSADVVLATGERVV